MSGFRDIPRRTNEPMDRWTNKVDYYGPHRVNPGPKWKVSIQLNSNKKTYLISQFTRLADWMKQVL